MTPAHDIHPAAPAAAASASAALDDSIFDFDTLDGLGFAFSSSTSTPPPSTNLASGSGSNSPTTTTTSTNLQMTADIFDLSHIPPFSLLDFAFSAVPSTPAEIVDFISRSQDRDQHQDDGQHQHYASAGASMGAGAGGKGKKAASKPLAIGSRSTNPSSFDAFTFTNLPSPGPSTSTSTSTSPGTRRLPNSNTHSPSSPTSTSSSSFSYSVGTGTDFFQFSPTYSSEAGAPGSSVGTDLTSPSPSSSPAFASSASASASRARGKARDTGTSTSPPPSLPPLSFSPTNFVHSGDGETRWPVQLQLSPSPLSLSPAQDRHDLDLDLNPRHHPGAGVGTETGTGSTSRRFSAHPGCSATAAAAAAAAESGAPSSTSPNAAEPSSSHGQAAVYKRLTHARSLTSLPVHNFRRFSLPGSPSPSQQQHTLSNEDKGKGKGKALGTRGKSRPSNLARRLLFRKHGHASAGAGTGEYSSEGCGTPLNSPAETETFDRSIYASFSAPATPRALQSTLCLDCTCTNDAGDLDLAMAMAVADAVEMETEVETAAEEGPPVSLFETRLPREVKVRIFGELVGIHVLEGERMRASLEWTALRAASRECRWVGREAGLVELVRLSTVSRSWRDLVFDGQLWVDFDFSAFPQIPETLLLKIASTSGSFVKSLDLSGQTTLTTATLQDVMRSLIIAKSKPTSEFIMPMPTTQLTSINFAGCTALTKPALHDLLMHTPLLAKLDLHGLPIVANETCSILGVFCPSIVRLNLSRCANIDMYGVMEFLKPRQQRKAPMQLKHLRLAGLKYANDKLMETIARYAPNLEVLDLSGVRTLHNTAIEAFVSCPNPEDLEHEYEQESVLLTARQAGRESTSTMSGTKYRRRVTQLRHLSLSHCHMLTDNACAHLAHAVPRLEFLELAGIGAELKDGGLVHLLRTTPRISRLDLDEACDISDAVIEALTPPSPSIEDGSDSHTAAASVAAPASIPGSQLEVLHLSYAVQVTNDALLALIRNCTRLRHLELDNTRVNGASVKEFVRLARARQPVTPIFTAARPRPGIGIGPGVPACISVVDCRNVGENAVRDLAGVSRTRVGWRGYGARFLHFLDARDDDDLGLGVGVGMDAGGLGPGLGGTDECDARRVALKSFFSWQTVDAVSAAREKARKSRRGSRARRGSGGGSGRGDGDDEEDFVGRRASRWWSPGSRFGSGSNSPVAGPGAGAGDRERDGCVIM